jgi:hypothetical protein
VTESPLTYPRMIRGALIGIDPLNPVASVIIFQYNPDTLTRTLQAQTGSESGDTSEQLRLKGPPAETIRLDVEIDATDQLERGDATTSALGIYPQLSALEMLIYPKSALVIANTVLLALGTIEVIPPMAPLTIFVWGPKRALPVKLSDFSITEEAHDTHLNPIRAKVTLGLRVLSYSDLPIGHPGYALFLAHQVAKEVMATIGGAGSIADVAGGAVRLV